MWINQKIINLKTDTSFQTKSKKKDLWKKTCDYKMLETNFLFVGVFFSVKCVKLRWDFLICYTFSWIHWPTKKHYCVCVNIKTNLLCVSFSSMRIYHLRFNWYWLVRISREMEHKNTHIHTHTHSELYTWNLHFLFTFVTLHALRS